MLNCGMDNGDSTPIARAKLIQWAHALEDYARDWDASFEMRPTYFTQEFWYLLLAVMIADEEGRPLTVGAACQAMKSGSNRTREERIRRAVDDGYLSKDRADGDGRSVELRPTPKLREVLNGHLERTYRKAAAALAVPAIRSSMRIRQRIPSIG